MINIVKYERPIIGYRLINAVVYASVPSELNDADAKQFGYEQVKSALEYEQTQINPSIDGSDMAVIEEFTPELPKVKSLKLIGNTYVQFSENETERTLSFTVEATNQYGDQIERDWKWMGAVDGVLKVTPIDEGLTVTVSSDGVTASVDVGVYPYVEPVYIKPIEDEITEFKEQTEMLLIGLADTYETQQNNSDMFLNAVAEVYEIILGGV